MSCEYNDCLSSSCKQCNEGSTTPFVSAPSSPNKNTLSTTNDAPVSTWRPRPESTNPSDFDFNVRTSKPGLSLLLYPGSLNPACNTMSTAEELFQNGQIKPLNARFSACICCNHAVHCGRSYDVSGHTYHDASSTHCAACKDSTLSRNVEHQQYTTRSHGQLVKLPCSESALEQWRRGVDRNNDKGSASLHAHAHPRVGRVTQFPSLPLASYGKSGSGHHHRRARSLSPLRVFHMDDMIQPRPSFESEFYVTHMSSVHTESKHNVAVTRPIRRRRRSRKSWTLKELLNLGDNKVHDKRPQVGSNGSQGPAKVERKSNVDTRVENVEDKGPSASADDNLYSKRNMHFLNEGIPSCSPCNLQRELKRAEHDEVLHAEEPKRRTFLSDKKGLLGCLGFTSKLSSVKGFYGASHFNAS